MSSTMASAAPLEAHLLKETAKECVAAVGSITIASSQDSEVAVDETAARCVDTTAGAAIAIAADTPATGATSTVAATIPASVAAASAPPLDDTATRKLFVGGLSYATTTAGLHQHFAPFGDIVEVGGLIREWDCPV